MPKKLLLYLALLLSFTLLTRGCNQNSIQSNQVSQGDIVLFTTKTIYKQGDIVNVSVQNNSAGSLVLKNLCPEEPLDVVRYDNGQWQKITDTPVLNCDSIPTELTVETGQKKTIAYTYWNHQLFSQLGRYQIQLTLNDKTYQSNEFTVTEPGTLGLLWREAIYRPIYNVLIFFASILPGHSLGLSIILLTILIRTILLIPSQKALKSQKKLQQIQPHLQHIQKTHKGNQQKIAEETMKIWREHKVNPLGSCLPIFIQLPILIALFYVIRGGINPDNTFLLYNGLRNFPLESINVNFLGILNLTKINAIILPVIIGLLQFFQIKLTMAKRTPPKTEEKGADDIAKQMAMMNSTMIYVMPVMIAVFTAGAPAGVGLYWGISTLFGIGQQLVVNKESDKGNVKVKVIE